MRNPFHLAWSAAFILIASPAAPGGGQWITFNDESALRLVSDPAVGISDEHEKALAHGDLDNDGDIDLVVARRQPTIVPRRNVLFMNEGVAEGHQVDGVLVDRTLQYATAADDGGQGMLDATGDADVVLVDVDNDGWLDVVTAAAAAPGQPVTISHPRIYMNRGAGPGGWLGLRYEHERIPMLHPTEVPCFVAVAAGDVTNDGLPDLYFGDNDVVGVSGEGDLNDRLLINQGGGYFADETAERMTLGMVSGLFANAAVIADFNADGAADIARARLSHVGIAWNDPASPGHFTVYEQHNSAPTHITGGDLNHDGRPDLLVTDDGNDRYLINAGNGADGLANFTAHSVPGTSGFGGESAIGDLDGDGLLDAIITDVDTSIPGCSRQAFVLRNVGTAPEPAFLLDYANLQVGLRLGTQDVAIFDLDGDGDLDVILARCTGSVVLTLDGCVADTNSDGVIDVDDLINVLLDWGTDGSGHRGDIDDSGVVDVDDLVTLIFAWGEC